VTTVRPDDAAAGAPGDRRPVDLAQVRAVLESYARRGLTDGLPVVPIDEAYVAEFVARSGRDPDEVLFEIPHLGRRCTVRLAAANAAMAGCLPEYFPVVVAAWEAIAAEPYPVRGIWQSTTGPAPLLIVNGPVRGRIGVNGAGNVFGSGHRANATIGRAIRLAAINVFGLRPHLLDQATQGTPAKYTCCIAENEEESPWPPLHAEHGFDAAHSTVAAATIRSVTHVEARHTRVPEQLALDITDTISRTGALMGEFTQAIVILGPEHARVFADAGWGKDDLRRFMYERAVRRRAELAAVGKDAVSRRSRWRLPAGHPDAVPDEAGGGADPDRVPVLHAPGAVQFVVAGADNAGVSAVAEIFGRPRDVPLSIARVNESP